MDSVIFVPFRAEMRFIIEGFRFWGLELRVRCTGWFFWDLEIMFAVPSAGLPGVVDRRAVGFGV